MDLNDVEWIETEPLKVTLLSEEPVLFLVQSKTRALMLSYSDAEGSPDGRLTFNGEYVNVGEQLMVYLGALDAAGEAGVGVEVFVEADED